MPYFIWQHIYVVAFIKSSFVYVGLARLMMMMMIMMMMIIIIITWHYSPT
jgi:hypothetical protein